MLSRLIGIETEYGLSVEGLDPSDLLQESRAVVCAYDGPCVCAWDYRFETPRRDLRGFTARALTRDPNDAKYDSRSAQYESSAEEHADRVLANGARLYNDHGHPEYATPECRSLRDLVAHDRAGATIVADCARSLARRTMRPTKVYKNNTDYHGAGYGTHESYLCARGLPYAALEAGLVPLLVTRQIFAGAGKVGIEVTAKPDAQFQLAQRSDFVASVAAVDTLANRPILNTRDESHAPDAYRRLHVIIGDANISEWATALKVGVLCLTLDALESGWEPAIRIEDPVASARSLSRAPIGEWAARLTDGRMLRATDIQRVYRDAAAKAPSNLPERDWVLEQWSAVLDDLDADPLSTADRVDWAAKRTLLESYLEETGAAWDCHALQSLCLAYHDMDPDEGLGLGLLQGGFLQPVVTADAVAHAMAYPPLNTRASLRGSLVRRRPEWIENVCWRGLTLTDGGQSTYLEMSAVLDGDARAVTDELLAASTPAEAAQALAGSALRCGGAAPAARRTE